MITLILVVIGSSVLGSILSASSSEANRRKCEEMRRKSGQ